MPDGADYLLLLLNELDYPRSGLKFHGKQPNSMGYETYVICGLIASPGDTKDARELMPTVFRSWNNAHAETEGVTLRSLLWEIDAHPGLGEPPQEKINKQLVAKADFLIAFFNTSIVTK